MADSTSDHGSDFVDDSIVRVTRVSSFNFGWQIKFIAAVDSEVAWMTLGKYQFGDYTGDLLTPVQLIDNKGKIILSLSVYGDVTALTVDRNGNCYVGQGKQVQKIRKDGKFKLIMSGLSFNVYKMSCRKMASGDVLLVHEATVNCKFDIFINKFNVYSLDGKLLKTLAIEQNGSHTVFLEYETIAVTEDGTTHFHNVNGRETHFRSFQSGTVFLHDLPFDQNGNALIQVTHNPFFQRKMEQRHNSNKSPAEIVLDEVVENCISYSKELFSRGFSNSLWAIVGNFMAVFECH